MYQALYRKYRPKNFNNVIGQDVIVRTLKNAIINEKISHAYLFTGPRGTGKTSVAKIFAKIINCKHIVDGNCCDECECCQQFNSQQNIDIIEIDAASNNGVDEIRELKNKLNLVPSFSKYKVYIIDEVHMLSTSAFNALLKTLEEPPAHVIFILATTDPHKVLPTILSRCQRFDFKKVSDGKIFERIKYIADCEQIEISDNAIKEIARLANGGLRDALSILDQVVAYAENDISEDDVHEVNGTITQEKLKILIEKLSNDDLGNIFSIINEYDESGRNFLKLTEELVLFYKNIMLTKKVPNYFSDNSVYSEFIDLYDENVLIDILNELNVTINSIKNTNNSRLVFELAIIKIINIKNRNKMVSSEIAKNMAVENNNILLNNSSSNNVEKNIPIIDDNKIKKLEQLTKIRINNTLARFNKKILIDFKTKLQSLNSKILDPDCADKVSMILDGELKAASDEYLVFVFKTDNITKNFNLKLPIIENFLNSEFKINYKVIGVSQDNWEFIKKDFNSKTKVYNYVVENINLDDVFIQSNVKNNETSIDSMFKNIVEYN